MSDDELAGVVFPADDGGARSTSALGRAVVADALREVDVPGALSAERDTSWHSGYLAHFRRLTVSGLPSREAALSIARHGLRSLHDRMRVRMPDGAEEGIAVLQSAEPPQVPDTTTVRGSGSLEEEVAIPYGGEELRGDALHRQLDRWVEDGILLSSCAEDMRRVMANPGWLRVPDHTVVVLGAGAEMGPLAALLRWGATVAAIDLPRPQVWERILRVAHEGAGTVHVPGADLPAGAGLDLIAEVPAAAEWIAGLQGQVVLGNYVYADGATHVRAAVAVDALTTRLQAARGDVSLAVLATPTDVFAVPREVVDHSVAAYEERSRTAKVLARPLRTVTGGRLMRRAYAPGVEPGICDALVPQQGPNYALAKRLQRWRAAVARDEGASVSLHVAPATRTRSVVKNRALKAAYAGAHRFGVEIFAPETTNTLMAALLVHDLHTGGVPRREQVWEEEAHAAAHGGLWTSPYAPPSVLGLAAVIGVGAAR